MSAIRDLPGIKEDELIKLGACAVCKKPLLAHTGAPLFYRLSISRAGFDAGAVRRRVGLEMQLGHAGLAQIMGPNEDIAKIVTGPVEVVVHENCADVNHLLLLFPDEDQDRAAG